MSEQPEREREDSENRKGKPCCDCHRVPESKWMKKHERQLDEWQDKNIEWNRWGKRDEIETEDGDQRYEGKR